MIVMEQVITAIVGFFLYITIFVSVAVIGMALSGRRMPMNEFQACVDLGIARPKTADWRIVARMRRSSIALVVLGDSGQDCVDRFPEAIKEWTVDAYASVTRFDVESWVDGRWVYCSTLSRRFANGARAL